MTENINQHIRLIILFLTTLLMMIFSTSCSDDFGDGFRLVDESAGNVRLQIPSVRGVAATRGGALPAGGEVALEEGAISTLYFLAYPSEGGEPKVLKLAEPAQMTAEYATYPVTLDPGSYRVYLLGNIESYTDKTIDKDLEEDDLKELILNFSPEKLPGLEDGLPMATLPGDILEQKDGEITVHPYKGATITADLVFLCSKVRLSLFYDNTTPDSFSYLGFGTKRPVISDFTLNNMADGTFLDKAMTPSHDYFEGSGAFTRMVYPDDIETEDDVRGYDKLHEMVASDVTEPRSRMAWQTTRYLPENRTDEIGKGTSLSFVAKLEDQGRDIYYRVPLPAHVSSDEGIKAQPLHRATFHDLSGCIRTISEFTVNATVEEWTLRNLAHHLHGPYHLKVEKTEGVPVVAGEETHLWYNSDVPVHFESQKTMIDGKEMDFLIVDRMEGHENDSIVITANPALPLDLDIKESYFDIIAGNIRKRINVSPFTIEPFFKVSPQYSVVEVREMIESGSNTLRLPLRFTTNLNAVKVRITEGWDIPAMPVEFMLGSEVTSQSGKELYYEGDPAHDGYNIVEMNGFISGNPYWSENHLLKVEYTAYTKDGTQYGDPVVCEIEIVPKRFSYRIYFRPADDDWISPHVYIYESLALPFTIDESKVQGPYTKRAGKPVGGFVFKNLGEASEAGLRYSFTGKLSFLGWSTQGGPACNDPYEATVFDPMLAEGFYVFGVEYPTDGPNVGKPGYGLKFIPPATRSEWQSNGASEATIRERYDIDTDYMAAHRSRLTKLCPACTQEKSYNIKYPGIRMLMSEEYPGWWYVDLSEVATPGKALVMFHDGHTPDGPTNVPGGNKPGIPLFNYADNEGWVYYTPGQTSQFVDNKPTDLRKYEEYTYRICWPKDMLTGIKVEMNNSGNTAMQSQFLTATAPGSYSSYDADFYYVEFKASRQLASRGIKITGVPRFGPELSETTALSAFKDVNGIRYLTFNGTEIFPDKPDASMLGGSKFRIYWPRMDYIIGFNMWFGSSWVVNNYDNSTASIIPEVEWITGSETCGERVYDYYEFVVKDQEYSTCGWQLHTTSGPYLHNVTPTLSKFVDKKGRGFRAIYRDTNFNIFSGTPPAPQGDDFRIYWRKYFTKDGTQYENAFAWIWGINGSPGDWLSPAGSTVINGLDYNYYDFSETTDFTGGGILLRSESSWATGVMPASTDMMFNRYVFDYDPAAGKNVIYINATFNGFE